MCDLNLGKIAGMGGDKARIDDAAELKELNDQAAKYGVDGLFGNTDLFRGIDFSKAGNLPLADLFKMIEAGEKEAINEANAKDYLTKAQDLVADKAKLQKALDDPNNKANKAALEAAIKTVNDKLKKISDGIKQKAATFYGTHKAAVDKLVADNKAGSTGKAQGALTGTGTQYSAPGDPGAGATTGAGQVQSALTGGPQYAAPTDPSGAGKAELYNGGGSIPLTGGDWTSGANAKSMIALTLDDNFINDAWDMVGEQQKRQQMMMLFFYYARMAMSGDIGAMYQFMRFIGYVIARDKALQNVWMGTKLIELQEVSRKATQQLLNTKVGNTLEDQHKWEQQLQSIKSQEGIVSTSQKLISQMMEEFTQIVETLTNVQKSLLDVNGKVLSNLSVWR